MEILKRRIERMSISSSRSRRRVDVPVGIEHGFEGGNGGGNGDVVVAAVMVGGGGPRSGVVVVVGVVEPKDSGGFGKHLWGGESCREDSYREREREKKKKTKRKALLLDGGDRQ